MLDKPEKEPVVEIKDDVWRWAVLIAFLLTVVYSMLIFFTAGAALWTSPEFSDSAYLSPFVMWVMLVVLTGWCLILALVHYLAPNRWWSGQTWFAYWYGDMFFYFYVSSAAVAGILFGTELDLWIDHYDTSSFAGNVFANSIADAKQNEAFNRTLLYLVFIMIGTGYIIFRAWDFRKQLWDMFMTARMTQGLPEPTTPLIPEEPQLKNRKNQKKDIFD